MIDVGKPDGTFATNDSPDMTHLYGICEMMAMEFEKHPVASSMFDQQVLAKFYDRLTVVRERLVTRARKDAGDS